MHDELIEAFAAGLHKDDMLLMPEPVYFGGTVERSVASSDIVREIHLRGRKAFAFADRIACAEALVGWAKRGDRIVVMGARDDSLSRFAHAIVHRLAGAKDLSLSPLAP